MKMRPEERGFVFIDLYKQEAWQAMRDHTEKHQRLSGGGGNEGKTRANAFTVASTGRNEGGRVSRLSTGWFE